jgi:DNA adenine methylase
MLQQQTLFGEGASAKPFVKWVGGKRQLLPVLLSRAPVSFGRYFEPFVGGGALFFALRPRSAVLSDINAELITAYEVVRDKPDQLISALEVHRYDADYFRAIRAIQAAALEPVGRAARFIYLNKTGYNGVYRVNSQGQFNVPFGKYLNPTICDENNLRLDSAALAGQVVKTASFEMVLDAAKPGDFVYFDPPYIPLSATSSFTSYTAGGFTLSDQKRLATVFRQLDKRGCQLMLSNSSVAAIPTLYAGYRIEQVAANRAINCKAERRGAIQEVLVRNF